MNKYHDKRIAFLVPDMQGAGTQRAQILIAQGASSLGYPVDLVVLSPTGPLQAGPTLRRIDLHAGTFITALPRLARYLKKEKPAALYSALNPVNLVAFLAHRTAGSNSRLVMAVQNHFEAKWSCQFTPTAPMRRLLFRWIYLRADHIISVSEGIREMLLHHLGLALDKVTVVHNPVDSGSLYNSARGICPHDWLRTDHAVPVIIAAGRLDRQKNFSTLIQAFHQLLKKTEARLVIIGEGPHRKRLEKQVRALGLSERVILPGFQANPHAWISRADLFVLSSLWEGFPLVLLESLALGTPAVATDCQSGPREIASIASHPLRLVPTGDIHQLANAMFESLDVHSKNKPSPSPLSSLDPPSRAIAYLRAAGLHARES